MPQKQPVRLVDGRVVVPRPFLTDITMVSLISKAGDSDDRSVSIQPPSSAVGGKGTYTGGT